MDYPHKNPKRTGEEKEEPNGLKRRQNFCLETMWAKQRKKPELKILKMLTNHVFCL
jgi:hypothetical protein